jgi:DNA adenine methylase
LSKIRAFWDSELHRNEDKIFREIITTCYGFSGEPVKRKKRIFRVSNPLNKLKRGLESWKDSLKDTKITNKDYGEIIQRYDSPDTFFFVDPPYDMTIGSFEYAEDTNFYFVRLETLLRLIKGKFKGSY